MKDAELLAGLKDDLNDHAYIRYWFGKEGLKRLISLLEQVHCKDCRFYVKGAGGKCFCGSTDRYPEKDDYCSKGERRHDQF